MRALNALVLWIQTCHKSKRSLKRSASRLNLTWQAWINSCETWNLCRYALKISKLLVLMQTISTAKDNRWKVNRTDRLSNKCWTREVLVATSNNQQACTLLQSTKNCQRWTTTLTTTLSKTYSMTQVLSLFSKWPTRKRVRNKEQQQDHPPTAKLPSTRWTNRQTRCRSVLRRRCNNCKNRSSSKRRPFSKEDLSSTMLPLKGVIKMVDSKPIIHQVCWTGWRSLMTQVIMTNHSIED